jgi:hypothetical protein
MKNKVKLKVAENLGILKRIGNGLDEEIYILHTALSKRTRRTIADYYFDIKKVSNEKFMETVGKNLIRLGALPKNYKNYTNFEGMHFMVSSEPLDNDKKQKYACVDLGDDIEKEKNPFGPEITDQLYPYVKITWERA